jgi:hypothetical protein
MKGKMTNHTPFDYAQDDCHSERSRTADGFESKK